MATTRPWACNQRRISVPQSVTLALILPFAKFSIANGAAETLPNLLIKGSAHLWVAITIGGETTLLWITLTVPLHGPAVFLLTPAHHAQWPC